MLDVQTIATVEAIIPLLVGTGPELTAHFYDRMLTHNPELEEIFNISNQCNGDQREVLFNAIVTYANSTRNLAVLLPAIEKIAQKHTSLQVKPGRYNAASGRLLATLDEIFNPDQEVLDAWGEAYSVLANVFINREARIYSESASKNDGWESARPFHIMAKASRNAFATSFRFESVDGGAVAEHHPGQYLGVWLKSESLPHQEVRQYLLTRKPNNKGYHIVAERKGGGQASTWLHSHANAGDIVRLAAPVGDFLMGVTADTPVSLISTGVGQTPMPAIPDTLAKAQHTVQVNQFHAAENGDARAFVGEVNKLDETSPRFDAHTWYRESIEADRVKGAPDNVGLMDSNKLESAISDPAIQFCLYGSIGFMQFVVKQLVSLDVKDENAHYECFGSYKVL